jgi:hypothetical protein
VSARAVPYPPPGYRLRVPEPLWKGALATMRACAMLGCSELGVRGSEALVYLAGVGAGAEMIVTGLYRLNHEPQGDRVVVAPEEARWLLRTLRARDEKLVGQLHSHRGLAGHSPGDDAWATSFHEGFLSIVVPGFGAAVTALVDCAVLEYRGGRFVPLAEGEVERRVRVYPQIVEHGAGVVPIETAQRREKGWPAFAARVKSIARKPR